MVLFYSILDTFLLSKSTGTHIGISDSGIALDYDKNFYKNID
jgi:hypothetical protein